MHIFLIKITTMWFSSEHTILVFATLYDVTHDLICKSYGCVYVIGENKVDYIPSEVTNEMLIFFFIYGHCIILFTGGSTKNIIISKLIINFSPYYRRQVSMQQSLMEWIKT